MWAECLYWLCPLETWGIRFSTELLLVMSGVFQLEGLKLSLVALHTRMSLCFIKSLCCLNNPLRFANFLTHKQFQMQQNTYERKPRVYYLVTSVWGKMMKYDVFNLKITQTAHYSMPADKNSRTSLKTTALLTKLNQFQNQSKSPVVFLSSEL